MVIKFEMNIQERILMSTTKFLYFHTDNKRYYYTACYLVVFAQLNIFQ